MAESETTRTFRRVRQMAALGTKSAVYDCILLSVLEQAFKRLYNGLCLHFSLLQRVVF